MPLRLVAALCSAMTLLYCLHLQSQMTTQGLPISIDKIFSSGL